MSSPLPKVTSVPSCSWRRVETASAASPPSSVERAHGSGQVGSREATYFCTFVSAWVIGLSGWRTDQPS
ncbi:hypothetical protein KSP35_17025 [Aquihabitans sp. G128]|uniref:hypothetical protein n=1 Tax=Aquihabitans sp. G128 TaxID=2849779 RepID=UPI001C22092D|nr:hypothetical protein [Aquihabitans sp. G128]QXC60052.1 hypothetical protein KSP35_17025 [Aquihabitans sp. G128]